MTPGPRPAILGVAGTAVTPEERALFREMPPLGFILFARNCAEPEQLRALTTELRALFPDRRVPILVDQEGGRVQRLRPPHWGALPPARRIGDLFRRDPARGERAAAALATAIAADLRAVGIDVDCAPVLDLAFPDTTDAIGDRSFGGDPAMVGRLGARFCGALRAAGVLPVIKHLPGHGRARVDSHHRLPYIEAPLAELERTDFLPFRRCRTAPLAMTAHVVVTAVDGERPATHSPAVLRRLIRERIGFSGILLSDDLAMNALSGDPASRARRALAAGCDVALYCPGDPAANAAVLEALAPAAEDLLARLDSALAGLAAAGADGAAARSELHALLTAADA